MPYEYYLKLEQEQREAQGRIAEEYRLLEIELEQERALQHQIAAMERKFGPGRLCACGMKCAQDCDCPF